MLQDPYSEEQPASPLAALRSISNALGILGAIIFIVLGVIWSVAAMWSFV